MLQSKKSRIPKIQYRKSQLYKWVYYESRIINLKNRKRVSNLEIIRIREKRGNARTIQIMIRGGKKIKEKFSEVKANFSLVNKRGQREFFSNYS